MISRPQYCLVWIWRVGKFLVLLTLLLWGFALGTLGPDTPNIYTNWLANNAAGALANYYNVNDYALGPPYWQLDQMTKPDVRTYRYYYDSSDITTVQDLFRKGLMPLIFPVVDLHLGDASNVQNRYEIMAYDSEPRSKALGGISSVTGFSPSDLQLVWPPDSTLNNYKDHRWHSAQFRFTNADQNDYWKAVMDEFGQRTTVP